MKRFFFRSQQKLKKEKEFAAVFKKGKRLEVGTFKTYYMENGLPYSRLGVSISKRVGNAVFRNRIKRVVREWFRLSCSQFRKPMDMVFTFNKAIPEYTNKGLIKSLDEIAL